MVENVIWGEGLAESLNTSEYRHKLWKEGSKIAKKKRYNDILTFPNLFFQPLHYNAF